MGILQPLGIAKQSWNQDGIERFEYPAMPYIPAAPDIPGVMETIREEARDESASAHSVETAAAAEELAEMLAEETQRAFAAGRERGLLEGRGLDREAHATALKAIEDERARQVAKLFDQFAHDRDVYLQVVEREIVKLALAVAARILRREAQMDPLLLTGAVRVALGQLAGSTEVRLRVPARDLDLWKDAVGLLPNLAVKPTVTAGEGMRLGDCTIETALGSVDLGIGSQLGEIERGFFDNAARRNVPAAEPTLAAVAGEVA
jgi:flagellar assembly protein FliH